MTSVSDDRHAGEAGDGAHPGAQLHDFSRWLRRRSAPDAGESPRRRRRSPPRLVRRNTVLSPGERKPGGTTGVDDDIAARFGEGIGAWILGRNMFGPIRGPWPDDTWRGWWGKNPPYHGPVFVLTHHERSPTRMEGGTVFHFVTGGIRDALDSATAAAAGKDVQIGGGVATIRQYLEAQLINELHVAIAPQLLGSGEHLFHGLDLAALGYACTTHVPTATTTHIVLTRRQ